MQLDAARRVTQTQRATHAACTAENTVKALSLALASVLLLAATPTLAADGGALYAKNCASCHGPDGKAATPAATAMKVPAIDGHAAASSVSHVKASDKHKALAGKLSDEDLQAIATHIAGL
jgi:mono/diheme cytochrome c family protein